MKIFKSIKNYLSKGQERSQKAKINIIYSFLIKFGNIIINLLYVPLLINYLGTEEYGIWLILTSILGWFSFFDIGIGNGLRNKFAEAKAQGDIELARIYVSTTYATMSIIFLAVGLIFSSIIPLFDWKVIFNTEAMSNNNLVYIVLVVFIFFILRFITQIISVILLADQRTALSSSFNLISNIIILIIILIVKYFLPSSLLLLGLILSGIPVLVFILASIYLFKKDYYNFRPGKSFIDFKYAKPIFNLGMKFFIIQISGIIFFSATNLIITQAYSPNEVTVYNIALKYFSVVNMFFGIILTPFWSAITDAFAVNDYNWIRETISKLKYSAMVISGITLIMLFVSPTVYVLWIGKDLHIPFSLSVAMAISSLIYIFFSPYVHFLNGTGKIKLNTYLVVIQSIIYIPVVYIFIKIFNFGVPGIVYASLLCEIPLRITQPMQYYKIINKKAKGIWNQ